MSTLRVSNIEAKADASSPTIDEKIKVTSSQGRVLVQIDGKTAGITSIGINTTSTSFTIDGNQNVQFVGVITAANVNTTGVSTFTSLNVTGVTTSIRLNVGTGGTIITTTAGGLVGIGTTNPTSTLVVESTNGGGRGAELSLVNRGSGTNPGTEVAINFGVDNSSYNSNDGNAQIKARNTGSSDATDLIFSTYNGSTFGERIRIGSTGQQVSFGSTIFFSRVNTNTEYSNSVGSANNPDGGYSSTTEHNYWVKLESSGGTHVVLNADGAYNSARNIYDHFTIFQKYHSEAGNAGRRLFSVDNAGQVQFGYAGVKIDKAWDNYPCMTVQRSTNTGDTNQGEFRVHGIGDNHSTWVGGAGGADFSVNFRIDGGTYFSSDARHKTNIVDNPYGLNDILQLQPRKFNRINSEGQIEENQGDILGFIAQEVKEVIPEAVNYYPNEDNPNEIGWCRAYALSDSYIVSTLVNAVKEQNDIINQLKSRIETLESQINT
jgi:hypothetical protein